MRKCLEIIKKYGFGVSILTKLDNILRDLDILKRINDKTKCVVEMTLTTYDEDLCKIIEPNVCSTKERFEVLKIIRDNNIPTIVWLDPILPFINDTEENLRGILNLLFLQLYHKIFCTYYLFRSSYRQALFPNLAASYTQKQLSLN